MPTFAAHWSARCVGSPKGPSHEPVPDGIGIGFTRSKVEPMVRGLFPRAEQDAVLATLEKSVVYVTSTTLEFILMKHAYDCSAWDLANLYLGSVGAELLGADAPRIVGLSESTTCYVSPDYFAEDDSVRRLHRPRGRPHLSQLQAAYARTSRDADEGVAARHPVSAARDVRVLVRGLRLRAGPWEEPRGAESPGH